VGDGHGGTPGEAERCRRGSTASVARLSGGAAEGAKGPPWRAGGSPRSQDRLDNIFCRGAPSWAHWGIDSRTEIRCRLETRREATMSREKDEILQTLARHTPDPRLRSLAPQSVWLSSSRDPQPKQLDSKFPEAATPAARLSIYATD